MTYYDAMVTRWATLVGATTGEKLAELNASMVSGPNVDVPVSSVLGNLLLSGAYWALSSFAAGSPNSNAIHDNALFAAKSLMFLVSSPNAPMFRMSDPTTYATVKGMMDVILLQETTVPGSTGFVQSIHDSLLGLCKTSVPWWQANGYERTFDLGDCVAAGVN